MSKVTERTDLPETDLRRIIAQMFNAKNFNARVFIGQPDGSRVACSVSLDAFITEDGLEVRFTEDGRIFPVIDDD